MSNITYSNGSLTFYDNDVALVTADSGRKLIWSTFTEINVPRAEVIHTVPGVDGIEVVDLGDRGRQFRLTGFCVANSEANLATVRNTIVAARNASTGTLVAKGDTLTSVELISYAFPRHVVGRGGLHYQFFDLMFRKGE